MDITVLTFGSRGDVQPYVALAQGLKSAGHHVRVTADLSFKDFIKDQGLEYFPAGDYSASLKKEMGRWLEGKLEFVRFFCFIHWLTPLMPSLLNDWWKACQRTDAIIYAPMALGGFHIAEKLGVPCFSAVVGPPLTPTHAFPSSYVPFTLPLGGIFNWFTHIISLQTIWLPFQRLINHWRKDSLGLPPVPMSGPYGRDRAGKTPFLYGFSPLVISPAPDWHDNVHITGYWFLNHDERWQPSKDLLEFLQAGQPPVYIGFGSMVPERSASLTRLTLEALERAGQRGILMSGWGRLSSERLPRNVFNMDFAPHDWLFPQMAAIVHHGGAGTVAETLRAGVPSVVVYFWAEQEYWGRKIANLGVGSPPISYGRLTAKKLARAISAVMENQSMHQRAAALGQKIRNEDGIRHAVAIVNKYLLK